MKLSVNQTSLIACYSFPVIKATLFLIINDNYMTPILDPRILITGGELFSSFTYLQASAYGGQLPLSFSIVLVSTHQYTHYYFGKWGAIWLAHGT